MASFNDDTFTQTATYWAPSATLDNYGNKGYETPVTIKCRWEQRTEIFTDPTGRERRSRARVFVDRQLATQGYLFLGTSSVASPTSVALAYPILDYREIPDLDGFEYERVVFL